MTPRSKPDLTRHAPPGWLRDLLHCQARFQRFLSAQPRFDESLSPGDYLRRLKRFWQKPWPTAPAATSHEQRLVQLAIAQSRLLARQSDLPAVARAVVEHCLDEQAPSGAFAPTAFPIGMVSGEKQIFLPFSGMFILLANPDKRLSGGNDLIVLAETGALWQAFASVGELWRYLVQRFAGEQGRRSLLSRLPEQHRAALPDDHQAYLHANLRLMPRIMVKTPYAALVRHLLIRQRRTVTRLLRTRHLLPEGDTPEQWGDLADGFNIRQILADHRNPSAGAYGAMARQLLDALPDLHQQGRAFMQMEIHDLTGLRVNPDEIWLHYFNSAASSDASFTGWRHAEQPRRSLTLSQLALANFTRDDESSAPGALDQVAGFYIEGPGSARGYGAHNEFRLLPSVLMARSWTTDFYFRFTTRVDGFWKKHAHDYRAMLKGRFIATCRHGHREGRLTLADYQALMALAGGPPETTTPVSLEQLNSRHLLSGADVRRFDLYGYASTDIVHFMPANGRQFLYLPDADQAQLLRFESTGQLQTWIKTQAQDPSRRATLAAHFSLYRRQDGTTWSGVDSALSGLADGNWSPDETIDRDDVAITGDLFDSLLDSIRERQRSDTDTLTTSNGELNEALWIADLSAFEQVALPVVPLGWPLGLTTACVGSALLGLGIDQTVSADTLSARRQGAWTTFYATLDLLFSAAGATSADDPFNLFEADEPLPLAPHAVPAERLRGLSADADGIYRLESNHWYVRSGPEIYRIAVSSVENTATVIRPEGDTASPLFFLKRVGTTEQWQRVGLKGGQSIAEDSWARKHVSLGARNDAGMAFTASVNGDQKFLCYDLEQNAFQIASVNAQTKVWQVLDERLFRPGQNGMEQVPFSQDVSNAERMATLKALDIDIELPLDFPLLTEQGTMPIPPQILSVWIGDQLIKPQLIRNLQNNAQLARRGARPYSLKLCLSSEHAEVFRQNLATLALDAPAVEVIDLERSAFYRDFQGSRYFEQYRAALDGNGGVARNYSSASDALRFQLMKYHGGLYMDLDDTLTDAWQGADLQTSAGGLAVNEPVSNPTLGLDLGFNTSCFATQPGNPLLEAMSAKSFERYREASAIYRDPRPVFQGVLEPQFKTYMQKISYISGPGVFNDVIDEWLPRLRQLKAPYRLVSRAVLLPEALHDELNAVIERGAPLGDLITIGADHSWATTR